MTGSATPLTSELAAARLAAAVRAPFVPGVVEELGRCGAYLSHVWPQLEPSIETAGFLGSALYMADMALDAAEEVYQPLHSRESLLGGALDATDLAQLELTLDVFHWVQPQLLLLLSALAEGWDAERVGGQGKPDPRGESDRERAHRSATVHLASPHAGPLPGITETLQLEHAPDLYRAVAVWPGYLAVAWEELQHLAAYPQFRRRGRALYFYARSSTRFLARPIEVNPIGLAARGVEPDALERAKDVLDSALPMLATMMMHCCAMRVGLGLTQREVVKPA